MKKERKRSHRINKKMENIQKKKERKRTHLKSAELMLTNTKHVTNFFDIFFIMEI